MNRFFRSLIVWSCFTLYLTAPALGADGFASLQRFSDFSKIDVKRLQDGEIISQRGKLMNFPNGISAQLCFIVPLSPAETARRLQAFDSSSCEAMKVYAYQMVRKPCGIKDFDRLHLDPRHRPVKWLLYKTLATTAGNSELNLSRTEAHQLAGCIRKDSSTYAVSACWAGLLFEKAAAFQRSGFTGIIPYESGTESVSPATQIRSMLSEQNRISSEFAPLLQRAGIMNGGTELPPLTPYYYWSMFEADHRATINLGAFYLLDAGDRYQLLDLEYFVSGNYYAAATFYEVWPIRDGDKTASLVWRGDFFAAPALQFTKGVERIAYGAIMIQEIKKEIRCFRDSLHAT